MDDEHKADPGRHTWYRVTTGASEVQLWCGLCGRPAAECSAFLAAAFGSARSA